MPCPLVTSYQRLAVHAVSSLLGIGRYIIVPSETAVCLSVDNTTSHTTLESSSAPLWKPRGHSSQFFILNNVSFYLNWREGVYRVLVGKPEGRRPLGRPRLRWVDDIRMDLQEMGCGYMDWIGLAQDRARWRTLVSAVMNLRVPWNAGNFLTSCKPVSFSRRTLHYGVSKKVSKCWNLFLNYRNVIIAPTPPFLLWIVQEHSLIFFYFRRFCKYKISSLHYPLLSKDKKVKCVLVQALRLCTGRTAHGVNRGIALLFLDHGKGWGVSVAPRPLFTPGKDPLPIVQEAGWGPRAGLYRCVKSRPHRYSIPGPSSP